MEILIARFQEFKLRVQAGEDKLSTCENLAKSLESGDKDVSSARGTKAFEMFLTDVIFTELKKGVTDKARDTYKIFDGLVKLKEQQEKNLDGSICVIFQKSCKTFELPSFKNIYFIQARMCLTGSQKNQRS